MIKPAMCVAGPLLVALSTVGCSQVAVLAPVAGDAIASVEFAAGDVLVDHKVRVKDWPACQSDGTLYRCAGATVDGKPIDVVASGKPIDIVVRVQGRTLYEGPLESVVVDAGRRGD